MAEVFKTFAIALDTKVASYVKVPVIEGDTGNRFVITLTDDGTAVDLSTSRVTAVFSGAMGTAMQDSWTSTDGLLVISGASHNIVTFDLLSGSYANGLNKCELQVYSGTSYTTLITSASFNFDAKRPILNDTTIASTTEYPILVSLIDQVRALTTREQADWNETDNTKGTFIENKPVVGADIQAAIGALETAVPVIADTVAFLDATDGTHKKTLLSVLFTKIFGSITGMVKADGAGNISAAAANVDFAAAAHASRHASGAADEITPIAIGALPYGAISSNLIINNFSVNQRAVSGTVTLASGVYGHDRWKGGASGGQYTFATSENVTTLTIAAGKSIIQVVEGLNLKSGTVCLSWTGTAQGKIGSGEFSASGVTGTAVGGTNLNIEFGAGTLSNVQLNYGSSALPFVPRAYADELRLCQRYYEAESGANYYRYCNYGGDATGAYAAERSVYIPFKVTKRTTPTITTTGLGTASNAAYTHGFRSTATDRAATELSSVTAWTADAEL